MSNELYLYGSVGASFWDEECFSPSDVREQLAALSGRVTVFINSGGGVATDGMAIYNILRGHEGGVDVVIDGIAASAASLIAMAGETITMRQGATMMIHDPASWYVDGRGTEQDHLKTAKSLGVLAQACAKVYAARAGISVEAAREIMRSEEWFDPDAAIQAGFADETDAEAADPAAMFDYAIYAHAPASVMARSVPSARSADREAAVATMAGIPVGKKEKPMTTKPKKPAMAAEPGEDQELAAATEDQDTLAATEGEDTLAATDGEDTAPADEGEDATDAEAFDASGIMQLAELLDRPLSEARHAIDQRMTKKQAANYFHASRQEETPMHGNTTMRGATATTKITADARDKFCEGAILGVMARAGIGGERNEYSGMRLEDLAREALMLSDPSLGRQADRRTLVGMAFTDRRNGDRPFSATMSGAHSTSDFGWILSNVMGKAALKGYEEADETFHLWTSKGTLSDFKKTTRAGLSSFADLPQVPENGEYSYGTIGDTGEEIALATYGKMLRISRQAILNDDLDLFGKIPMRMGRAAKRTIGNLVYAILTGNPTLSDGTALFHANHKNVISGGTSALGVVGLGLARAAMRSQKDGDAIVNVKPRYLLVPAVLETAAMQVINSTFDPSDAKGHASNPVAGMAEVVTDPRLDEASLTAWYLAADPAAVDTVEVAYLDGNETPRLEQQEAWTTDGVEFKVGIDAGVAPLGYQGLLKSAGA